MVTPSDLAAHWSTISKLSLFQQCVRHKNRLATHLEAWTSSHSRPWPYPLQPSISSPNPSQHPPLLSCWSSLTFRQLNQLYFPGKSGEND
ncbi:transcription elongation factor s-ii [Moniliophthora roreri]|nr:transcription elongation factor s-ii [Moniliophthora roreri]